MIYRLVDQWQQKAGVTQACRVLNVSRSGYYTARKMLEAAKSANTCATSVHLKAAFAASDRSYEGRGGSCSVAAVARSACGSRCAADYGAAQAGLADDDVAAGGAARAEVARSFEVTSPFDSADFAYRPAGAYFGDDS